mmetsp:Transcript_28355/g.78222  ORF Transcript_28355/g.78222 Transcript_28355/m.78222 type:complete len:90 (+) Transcript_28355:63-332(+)
MGCAMVKAPDSLPCANDSRMVKGDRVQTCYDDVGGDGKWYQGTVTRLHANRQASIAYDDGDSWTGPTQYIHKLNANYPVAAVVQATYVS